LFPYVLFKLLTGRLVQAVFVGQVAYRLMEVLNGRVVDLKLSEELSAYEIISLHGEILHLKYHFLECVEILGGNLRHL